MVNNTKVFTCPNCARNLFEVGVTRCSKGSHTITSVDFNDNVTTVHDTRINSSSEDWIKCNHCHTGMDIEIYQLNQVLIGKVTEALIKVRCGIACKPVFKCPKCEKNIFTHGFIEVLYGGTARSEITMHTDGYDMGDVDVVEFDEQWTECASCSERIDMDAIDLINYHEGECSFKDIEDI